MRGLWPLCLALAAAPLPAQVTLSGDTSRPEMSVFAPHEPVELTFTVAGRTAATGPLTLALEVVDVHDRALTSAELTVPAGEGEWTGTWAAPAGALGFYRVRARLSNGVEMAALGTRPAGYLTYAVLPDPATRPEYPAAETFYGMQGGFNDRVNVVPWLGVRWMLGSYDWRRLEPDRPGQFAETHAARGGRQATNPWQVDGQPWVTYPLPTLFMAPPWALTPETAAYVTGSLTPEGETAWVEYCGVAAAAFAAERPELPQRLYQITWEPVYPWGFRGTTAELVRVYELAYPAIHAADPAAVVLGPTGAGISAGDVEWNARLLAAGLGAYIDAFSIHPYHPLPPERNGLVEHVRALREVIRTHLGRDLDCYGTEQGWATNDDPSRELLQAQGLTRAHLIMLGEGFRANFGFYIADYPAEPGYGYFYNLNPNIPYGTDKMSPKPVAAAFAQQTMLLEGHRSAGAIEWLGDTALGYAYERGPEVTLALWDWGDAPREVSLPVGVEQVVVHDWLGGERTVATPGGTLALTLGPEPRYVVGVAASVWGSTAVRPIELEPSGWSGYPGASITVTGSADTAAEGTLRVELDPRLGPSPAPVP
ncbi:MAG TPA: hypothetical protein DCZ72_13620, partial [Armatimonadetes bacterium]|nr:hypothetical protein [Armatimonadota bacterium]